MKLVALDKVRSGSNEAGKPFTVTLAWGAAPSTPHPTKSLPVHCFSDPADIFLEPPLMHHEPLICRDYNPVSSNCVCWGCLSGMDATR